MTGVASGPAYRSQEDSGANQENMLQTVRCLRQLPLDRREGWSDRKARFALAGTPFKGRNRGCNRQAGGAHPIPWRLACLSKAGGVGEGIGGITAVRSI